MISCEAQILRCVNLWVTLIAVVVRFSGTIRAAVKEAKMKLGDAVKSALYGVVVLLAEARKSTTAA